LYSYQQQSAYKISRALGRITETKEKLQSTNDKLAMARVIDNIKFRE